MDTDTPDTMARNHPLGTLYHDPVGAVYKYGKVDFGALGPHRHVHYVWFPWNGRARAKPIPDEDVEFGNSG